MVRTDRPLRAVAVVVGATAAAGIWTPSPGVAEDVPSDPAVAAIESTSDERRDPTSLPAFLRDTALTLRFRTYYVDNQPAVGLEREAWAAGGWLAYRSGWLLDAFQLGATAYGSAPLYDPADKADTVLLAPGGEGYYVLGEAFGALRFQEYVVLKAYRQLVDQPYINAQDNAMTPNTFEGATLGGAVGPVKYAAGYLTRMKARNADVFAPMSEAAGARGTDRGVAMLGVLAAPLRGLEVEVAEQYGLDTFNTLFARVDEVAPLGSDDLRLRVAAQVTDQRSVGDALVAPKRGTGWSTWNASGLVALTYRALTLRGGGSLTAPGNRIQSPWGFFPGYLRCVQLLFNNAAEQAWLAGVAFDFSRLVAAGLTASFDAARGVSSVDPATRRPLPDEAEYDLSVIYFPPWTQYFRVRLIGVRLEQEGAQRTGYQVRVTVNWELPLARPPAAGAGPATEGPRGPRDR